MMMHGAENRSSEAKGDCHEPHLGSIASSGRNPPLSKRKGCFRPWALYLGRTLAAQKCAIRSGSFALRLFRIALGFFCLGFRALGLRAYRVYGVYGVFSVFRVLRV